jgi:CRP/FNR family cyclic AMP-dependent transcriptional regulator
MKKILLIEKDEDIRANLAQVLELVNYEVFTAEDGQHAAELAKREIPELIICGSLLPLLDGYGLFQELQSNPSTQHSKVVFFTPKHLHEHVHSNGHDHEQSNEIEHAFSSTTDFQPAPTNIIASIRQQYSFSQTPIETNSEPIAEVIRLNGVEDVLEVLIKDRDILYYKKKQVIFSEGNCSRNLYFVKKGKVKIYQTNDIGKQLVVDLYAENDFIGYIPLIENSNYTEIAEALEDTELIVIPRGEFNQLIKTNQQVMNLFIHLLTKSVSEKKCQMIGLAYNSLRKKVADALIRINDKYNKEDAPGFRIDISRDNLAAIAGTATESLIRTLTDFKSEKLIDISNNCIKILNKKRLEDLSN